MSYQIEQVRALSAPDFRRLLGVKPATFEAMLSGLVSREAAKKKRGRPPDLGLAQQLLLTLQFWREYRTDYHLAMAWPSGREHGLPHDQTGGNALLKSGVFALPVRPKAGGSDPARKVVIVDVTEPPVERPKKSRAPALLGQKEASPAKKPGGRGQKERPDPGGGRRQGA